MYTVKEIYTTLQGEGAHTGRTAVFLRFAGLQSLDRAGTGPRRCGLPILRHGFRRSRWPGRRQICGGRGAGPRRGHLLGNGSRKSPLTLPLSRKGRGENSVASGTPSQHARPTPSPLAGEGWGEGGQNAKPYVVCTGGEPLLQLDEPLIEALHACGFEIAIETNGTQPAPPGIDWICVSPEAHAPLVLASGNELKLVFPQEGAEPARFERLDFRHFFLQPMDGPSVRANIEAAARYCLSHPRWRLSLQTHKLIGLP